MAIDRIRALLPRGPGRRFVFYGDSCSGVAGALHEGKLAKINGVVRRIEPEPEFVVFPGDEIIGLVPDESELRAQWRHFLDVEMAWLDRRRVPMFHATGNHTTYDATSERVFSDVMSHLPRNGPAGQEGLAYFVRDGDLLLVFVHTLWSGLGGEGHMELAWLSETLRANAGARWKFVVGHHPAFAVNGFSGPYQRTIGDEYVAEFWSLLTGNGVLAYLCSHILAFDVQCHQGVLQITSAGAGTAHRMPETEYLHCVQMAVDRSGLRYQVLDEDGDVRETLAWPPREPATRTDLAVGANARPWPDGAGSPGIVCVTLRGRIDPSRPRQTMLAALDDDGHCPLWIGLVGRRMQLTVTLQPERGRSPHQWLGPSLADVDAFDLDLMLNADMGPGGILWRARGSETWTGLIGMSAWGTERIAWPERLHVGAHGRDDVDTPFVGRSLSVSIGAVHDAGAS